MRVRWGSTCKQAPAITHLDLTGARNSGLTLLFAPCLPARALGAGTERSGLVA